jgi:hypothetical protein
MPCLLSLRISAVVLFCTLNLICALACSRRAAVDDVRRCSRSWCASLHPLANLPAVQHELSMPYRLPAQCLMVCIEGDRGRKQGHGFAREEASKEEGITVSPPLPLHHP